MGRSKPLGTSRLEELAQELQAAEPPGLRELTQNSENQRSLKESGLASMCGGWRVNLSTQGRPKRSKNISNGGFFR